MIFKFAVLGILECSLTSKKMVQIGFTEVRSESSLPFESLCGRGSREMDFAPASTDDASSTVGMVIDTEGALATSGEQRQTVEYCERRSQSWLSEHTVE